MQSFAFFLQVSIHIGKNRNIKLEEFHKARSLTKSMTEEDIFTTARLKLTEVDIRRAGITNEDVLRAMRSVRRHKFIPVESLNKAYENHPLPIGYGQTISQPYIVAVMTELLALKPGEKVLEIGTGSSYQAAILAELQADIYTIEIIPELARKAVELMKELGYAKVHIKEGDGYFGWSEFAPFDAIIVTAAPDHVPTPLVEQLAEGGRLVIPIGLPWSYQVLWKYEKKAGELKGYDMGGVCFVPFTGHGVEQHQAKHKN